VISGDRDTKTTEREKQLQQRVNELTTLYEVSKILTSAMNMNRALELIVKTTAEMMGMKACGVRLLDKRTGEMILKAVYGLSQDYIHKGRVFMWKGVYKDVILKGQVAVVNDVVTDPRFDYTEEAISEGIKSMLSVGLIVGNEIIGALSVYTDRHQTFTNDQIRIFKGIANEAATVIEKAMFYEERMEKQQMDQELALAAKIQSNLMPKENPKISGYEIAAKNIPSRMVGGDFYDFIVFDDSHLGIVIADVSGKGIPGAILMASTRATLRAYLEDPHSVRDVIRRLNLILCRDTRLEQFVTLFYGMLDIPEGTFTYVNAGHNFPVLLRGHERIELRTGGPILGILNETSYEAGSVNLIEGDTILFYTDGITEAERYDEYFGVEHLLQIVESSLSRSTDSIVEKVLKEVEEFSLNSLQDDDRTIVILKKSSSLII